MNRRKWLWTAALAVPVVVGGGLAYASGTHKGTGYTCPVTGEELACDQCCPLNAKPAAVAAEEPKPAATDGCTCPLTGETLGCPNCCPLTKAKK
ncbi:MAG: hypothetical protein K2X87_19945 [Gemmataceae bacterium]|nr:hypothetical protein [Gemmataceae bacterium]